MLYFIFFLRQLKEKINQVDDEQNDTLSYDLRNTYYFRPDLSKPLTGDEESYSVNLLAVVCIKKNHYSNIFKTFFFS